MSKFQWIINNAAQIDVNDLTLTASTVTRDGRVRSVVRGSQPWVFTVTLPNGARWTDYRDLYAEAQRFEKTQTQTIQFNHTGHEWMFSYQGTMTPQDPSDGSFLGSWSEGSTTFTMTGGTGLQDTIRVKAGDIVQLGPNGYVYKIVETAMAGQTTNIRVHRPIIESGSGKVFVGEFCTFTVICTQFPKPVFFAQNQVGWSSAFIFTEVI